MKRSILILLASLACPCSLCQQNDSLSVKIDTSLTLVRQDGRAGKCAEYSPYYSPVTYMVGYYF